LGLYFPKGSFYVLIDGSIVLPVIATYAALFVL
jgi:hypothetical protein